MTCGVNFDAARHPSLSVLVAKSLRRHICGDWGDCYADDAALNDMSLGNEGRIFSVYNLPEELTEITVEGGIWISREGDRSATTVLYPSEY